MPLIKQKPSLNHEVVKTMTKKELIDLHPLADEDYLSGEWDKINQVEKPEKSKTSKAKDGSDDAGFVPN